MGSLYHSRAVMGGYFSRSTLRCKSAISFFFFFFLPRAIKRPEPHNSWGKLCVTNTFDSWIYVTRVTQSLSDTEEAPLSRRWIAEGVVHRPERQLSCNTMTFSFFFFFFKKQYKHLNKSSQWDLQEAILQWPSVADWMSTGFRFARYRNRSVLLRFRITRNNCFSLSV